jgi:hypothetical protein
MERGCGGPAVIIFVVCEKWVIISGVMYVTGLYSGGDH